jgi:transposase
MLIIGVDFHSRFQQIAMVDTETGELIERRLDHSNGEAQKFYAELRKRVRVAWKQPGTRNGSSGC